MARMVVLPAALLAAGTVLSLAGCGGETAVSSAGEENPLATTTWTLVSYLDDAGDESAAVAAAPSTLSFGEDRFVTGNTGCNSLRGSYELDGDRLSVTSTVTTRAACVSPEAGRQERAVLAGLAGTIRYVVSEGELALLDGRGGRLLVYAPASTDLADTRWGALGIDDGTGVVSGAATEAVAVEFRDAGRARAAAGRGRLRDDAPRQRRADGRPGRDAHRRPGPAGRAGDRAGRGALRGATAQRPGGVRLRAENR